MTTPRVRPNAARELWKWFLVVVAGTFVVFIANFRELGLTDTIPATLLAASIVRDFDLSLDEFEPMLDRPATDPRTTLRDQMNWTLAIRKVRGHLRSSYPVGAAVLAAPVFAGPAWTGNLRRLDDYRAVGKIAASLITALSSGFVFLCLLRFTERKWALLLTATYAFGTSVWTTASQALWQHGPALLCLSVATWAALGLEERDGRRNAFLVSLGCGMAIACRPQNAVSSAAIFGFALLLRPRRFLELALPAVVIGALVVWYDVHAFGTISGGYEALYGAPVHAHRHLTAVTALSFPLADGLSGLLVSPSRGLFVYSPVLFTALLGLAVAAVRNTLARFLMGWVIVTFCFYAKNQIWWGGTSYGPRYMTELALPLVLGLGMVFDRIAAHRTLADAVMALATVSIAVQALGAVTWECGWHIAPYWLDYRPDRLWDFRDPEILRCLDQLEQTGPQRMEFGPFAPRRQQSHL